VCVDQELPKFHTYSMPYFLWKALFMSLESAVESFST
jgi:hypothetical protein